MTTPNATVTLTRIPFPAGEHCNGHAGCGQCSDCKRNSRRALAKTLDCDRPYLGLPSFKSLFPTIPETTPPWLVNHWPKTRQALRRKMLEEALPAEHRMPSATVVHIINGW